ncbi:MAG TPA: hypothetical protein VEW71_08620 [Allosphingosinicella sp.]|nr:hypothetical protein [Allosphingosinicella sp.]
MSDIISQWIVENSFLQGLAIVFSIVLGSVWLFKTLRGLLKFLVRYKSETLDTKLRIARYNRLKWQYLYARDESVFIARLVDKGIDILLSVAGILFFTVILTSSRRDPSQIVETTLLVFMMFLLVSLILSLISVWTIIHNVRRWRVRWFEQGRGLPRPRW